MELAGLKVVLEGDADPLYQVLSKVVPFTQQVASAIKAAFNGLPDFAKKFNFSTNGAGQAAQDTRELARAERELAAARLDDAKAAEVAARTSRSNESSKRGEKDAYGQLVAENNALVRAYYNAAAAILKQGDAAGISAQQLEEMRKKALAGQEQLAAIEAGAGRFQRNVGNYASVFNPLNNAINQIARELPSFTNSIQTGFMALSNQWGALFDALSQITKQQKSAEVQATAAAVAKQKQAEASALAAGMTKAEAKEAGKLALVMGLATPEQLKMAAAARLSAEGLARASGATAAQATAAGDLAVRQALANVQMTAAPSVFKALTAAIFSWQTALSIGVTVLTLYGPKLIEAARGLLSTESAADKAKKAQKELTEATEKATESAKSNAAEEISRADVLYRVATSEVQSKEARINASKQLIDLYPKIFNGLNQEAIMAGRAANAYALLTSNLKDKIALEVGEEQLKVLYKQQQAARAVVDQNSKLAGVQDKIVANAKELNAISGRQDGQKGVIKLSKEQQAQYEILAKKGSELRKEYMKMAGQTEFSGFDPIKAKEQTSAIDELVRSTSEYEKQVNSISSLRGSLDNIFPDVKLKGDGGSKKDVKTAADLLKELTQANKNAVADFEVGAITLGEKSKQIADNWIKYASGMISGGFGTAASKDVQDAIQKAQLLNATLTDGLSTNELQKLPVAFTQIGNVQLPVEQLKSFNLEVGKLGQIAVKSFGEFRNAVDAEDAANAIEKMRIRFGEAIADFQKDLRAAIQNVGTSTVEGIGALLGDILAENEDPFGKFLKGMGQLLGDQIIALGKQLIAAGGIMQAAQKAIAALGITPAAAIAVGIAAVAGGAALKAALSKQSKGVGRRAFADGGVVYGPTNALIGEYSGASNNPEVVAPLDKLKSIIKGEDFGGNGQPYFVTYDIKGQDLRLVLQRADKAFGR